MEVEQEVLGIFNRYLVWVKENKKKDDFLNYLYYCNNIEKIRFEKWV